MTVARLAKKYGAVIFFPTFTIVTVLADWTHTQAWKKQQLILSRKTEFATE